VKCANHHAGLRVTGEILQPRNAEVDDLDIPIRLHHDICRLYIAMNDPHPMGIAQAEAGLVHHFQLVDE